MDDSFSFSPFPLSPYWAGIATRDGFASVVHGPGTWNTCALEEEGSATPKVKVPSQCGRA